jgi:predicted permease
MQDELSAATRRALTASDLPEEIQERIFAFISVLPLGADEAYDVALELIAHFEDGLSAGRPSAELLKSFGDERTVVRLIRKTKRRQRPLPRDTEHIMSGDFFLSTLWQYIRYAGRRLAQSPGFTATAVLSLALGIGANTAIFSLVNAVVLKDPPFEKPEELVSVLRTAPDFPYGTFAFPDYEDLRDGTKDVFKGVSASQLLFTQTDRDGGVEMVIGEGVSGSHFPMLGLKAELGRTLLPEDDLAEGAHPVVMLGYGYWQRAFGADPDVVGEEIRLGGRLYKIVGVAPEDYTGSLRGLPAAVFAPLSMAEELFPGGGGDRESRSIQSLLVKARLAPGITMVQAQAVVDGIVDHLLELKLDDFDPETGFLLVPAGDVLTFPGLDPFLHAASWLLMVVVGIVLLIVCTNLASFLLAKGVERRREIAVRVALGAGRRHLMGQLLSETVLLGILGGIAGVLVAFWFLQMLVTADLPLPLPITLDLSMDTTVLGFSIGISLLAGIMLGLVPALHNTRPDVGTTLRDESTGSGGRRRHSIRNTLVVAQVAGSLVVLVTAGLFLRSAQNMDSLDAGFGREPTAILSLFIPTDRYSDEECRVFTQTLLERFRSLPGVEAVGLIGNLHLNAVGRWTESINVDGVEPPPGRGYHVVDFTAVSPRFFEAAGIQVLKGRDFTEHDRSGSPRVVLVNQAFAERFWPGRDPIGQTIRRGDDPDFTVAGVTSNTKVRSLVEPPRPFIYRPYNQVTQRLVYIIARTSIDPEQIALDMLTAGRELDPELWVWEVKTMERLVSAQLFPTRMAALALSAFAVLALALAGIGLYGIVSYAVSRKTREVGIRISLGADHAGMVRLLMGNGMKLVAVGGVIGLAGAYVAARLLTGLLYDVEAFDPTAFVAVPVVLVVTAMLAAYIPARRASRIDPATALRME